MNKIDENWDLFEHKTKIRAYLKKLDENWDQKGILTYFIKRRLFIALVDNFVKVILCKANFKGPKDLYVPK